MGDRAAAVSTYHHCASVLERELGVAPDDATRAAFRRLMTRDRPTAPGGDGPPVGTKTAQAAQAAGRPGQPRAPLIGRAAELRVLTDVWQAASAGRRGMVLVAGGAGVGKTRLVTEVAELARRQGAVVVATQCFAAPGRLALAPVADWLRDPAVRAAAATLDPAWRAEVARLLPDQGVPGGDPRPGTMADAWQRHRFYEGLARALIAVGRPLFLVLDNVQWCDQETLDFVSFSLGLASDETPLLVAGTVRDDHRRGDRELAAWAVRMRAAGLLTELALSPLDAADGARLAEAISGRALAAADAATLYATTGGFPLYVIEAARGEAGEPGRVAEGGGSPPGDLSAVLRRRLAQATPGAQEVAGLAAAVGTDFSLDLLTEASDLTADAVVEAIDELWRSRILREFGTGYDFSHDLLREAAYAEVSPARRWLLHRRIAQGLELLHAGATDAVAAQLAAQYARSGDRAKAVAYFRQSRADRGRPVRAHRGDPAVPGRAVGHRGHARRAGPRQPGTRGAHRAGRTAQRQGGLRVARPGAEHAALDRARRIAGPRRPCAGGLRRPRGHLVRPGQDRRLPPGFGSRARPRRARDQAPRARRGS